MIHLQSSMIAGLKGPDVTVDSVRKALQQAIELEHATIPTYLYALYSLHGEGNAEIVEIIQSIVVEEMLHMTLASNILNALGGSPQIDHPGFIPTYPGPLPGGVAENLTVNLAKFSMEQLEAFLQIEEPEHPLNFQSDSISETPDDQVTIGQFYTLISEQIEKLGDAAFVDPPRNQVGPDLMHEAVTVVDVASAQLAIREIMDQGEGTSTSPEEIFGPDYAHYYRFMEIKEGRRLVKESDNRSGFFAQLLGAIFDLFRQIFGSKPSLQYTYSGAPVPFDSAGVYDVALNPSSAHYPVGSTQAFANDNFNYTYTSLLLSLHTLFNGENTQDQVNRAIGLMMSLKGQAKAMMAGIPDSKILTGPSFEYQPVNPRATDKTTPTA